MLWTALLLGFAGSLHCMGMCSPLAMAVTNMSPRIFVSRLLYNGGRIATYGILGGIVASVGLVLPLTEYQDLLSVLLGIALLLIGVTGVSNIRAPFLTKTLERFSLLLKGLFSKFLQRRSHAAIFILGSFNGMLPCGLSFLALTYCVTLAGPADGFTFMIAFGAGTLPVMLGFTTFFKWVTTKFAFHSGRITTSLLIVSGVLLIVRVFIVHLPEGSTFGDAVDIVVCR